MDIHYYVITMVSLVPICQCTTLLWYRLCYLFCTLCPCDLIYFWIKKMEYYINIQYVCLCIGILLSDKKAYVFLWTLKSTCGRWETCGHLIPQLWVTKGHSIVSRFECCFFLHFSFLLPSPPPSLSFFTFPFSFFSFSSLFLSLFGNVTTITNISILYLERVLKSHLISFHKIFINFDLDIRHILGKCKWLSCRMATLPPLQLVVKFNNIWFFKFFNGKYCFTSFF